MAFENFGEITSAIYHLLIFVNVIPILLFVFNFKKTALVALLILGTIIIPENLIVNNRLIKLKEETSNIILFAYQNKINNGSFPKNINGYKFKYPELKEYINYTQEFINHSENKEYLKDHFGLNYHVGTRNTSHMLMKDDYFDNSEYIQWYYYPD
ncbi:hypothetical protein DFQ11_1183 [Winogradskyella epiphytica]|uniref:Uncharacterized protein n=1 Tax=Winogradskyella epiphytica TaxID=262005 RepID=A0A2V4XPQ1_9FLAO|nr:hypothetical protein [Winogradskyella epiphytica]PYE78786.1 hypothetical protein DFQ11_1183 [Winogradskyella epiphytica]GGW75091.1 hypothetical protein GCM10008085_28840 [Winogradskyella epiphytica]